MAPVRNVRALPVAGTITRPPPASAQALIAAAIARVHRLLPSPTAPQAAIVTSRAGKLGTTIRSRIWSARSHGSVAWAAARPPDDASAAAAQGPASVARRVSS